MVMCLKLQGIYSSSQDVISVTLINQYNLCVYLSVFNYAITMWTAHTPL